LNKKDIEQKDQLDIAFVMKIAVASLIVQFSRQALKSTKIQVKPMLTGRLWRAVGKDF